jgi:hypothetical protein
MDGKQNPPSMANHCVFIKGIRAKRIFFRTKRLLAAAKPARDDPDNNRDDEVHVSRVPGASKVGILRL